MWIKSAPWFVGEAKSDSRCDVGSVLYFGIFVSNEPDYYCGDAHVQT
jgi:hypothetical protein